MKWQTFASIISQYPTANKDGKRIQMFFKECARKEAELIAAGNVKDLEMFTVDAIEHMNVYIKRLTSIIGNPFKWFGDPFKGERELTRAFARSYGFSDEFKKLMG